MQTHSSLEDRAAAELEDLESFREVHDLSTPGFESLSTILEDPSALDPPKPVVPRLAWRGRVTLLAAREKDGKSTLASAAAAAVSAGAAFLEGDCHAGPVLWVNLEEHRSDLVRRLVQFEAQTKRLLVAQALESPFEQLEEAAAATGPALVVVDTLAAFADGLVDDPSSSSAWTPVMVRFGRLARDFDCAILLLHHARKSDGKYRDSTAIGAGVDVVLEARCDKEDSTVRHLSSKGRFPVPKTSLRFDGEGYQLVGAEQSLAERIVAYLRLNPRASKRQVRNGVAGRSVEIDAALRALEEDGAVRDLGSTRNRNYVATEDGTQAVSG